MACESLFWARWMRNTIRNVMIVVTVLITSCQVSKLSNSGRLNAQATSNSTATTSAWVDPDQSVAWRARRAKNPSWWRKEAGAGGVFDLVIGDSGRGGAVRIPHGSRTGHAARPATP